MASIPQMIFEALTKEDDGRQKAAQLVARSGALRHDESHRRGGEGGGRGFVPRRLADECCGERGLADHSRLRQQGAAGKSARSLFAAGSRSPGAGSASDRSGRRHPGKRNPLERIRRGRVDDVPSPGRAERPRLPRPNLLRAIFVSCVDHTPATPSSLAAITSYSGGNLLKTSLAAGITAMGESHAGAGEGTARILLEYHRQAAPLGRRLRGRRRARGRRQGSGRLHHQ